jgi:hypothetical protein
MLVLSPQQLPMIQPPLNVDVNPLLEQALLAIQGEYMHLVNKQAVAGLIG